MNVPLGWRGFPRNKIHFPTPFLTNTTALLMLYDGTLCPYVWNGVTMRFNPCRVEFILGYIYLSIIQYVGLYVFSLPIYIIYMLCLIIIIKSEAWNYYPLLRVRSWNNGFRCMSFYILTISLKLRWHRCLQPLLVKDKDLFILQNEYHCCWWPGDVRRLASTTMPLTYRKVSNTRRTKYQNLNDSRLILQLSVPSPLKPSVKSIMKM